MQEYIRMWSLLIRDIHYAFFFLHLLNNYNAFVASKQPHKMWYERHANRVKYIASVDHFIIQNTQYTHINGNKNHIQRWIPFHCLARTIFIYISLFISIELKQWKEWKRTRERQRQRINETKNGFGWSRLNLNLDGIAIVLSSATPAFPWTIHPFSMVDLPDRETRMLQLDFSWYEILYQTRIFLWINVWARSNCY